LTGITGIICSPICLQRRKILKLSEEEEEEEEEKGEVEEEGDL
jgi:hypothetical protein